MIAAALWGFLGGIIGGILVGIVVQRYAHRLRVKERRSTSRSDAISDLEIACERIEDAWQSASGPVSKARKAERQRVFDDLRDDLKTYRSAIGPDLHRLLRDALNAMEEAASPRGVRQASREALEALDEAR